ncbi:unnamed protein product [Rotaria magnacalcarata]|uniref:Uncharacterized protein n=1 Tax=Rotaria magnacalcarata TaxID=392030 RepID=A0A818YN81_9BILA|nr:unnamed protein product [Rotaria magnacalcarata]CAF3757882.1 unnamed protein product [Rotaria magnacalcarata]CAF4006361.1 unnamed protein product [Rotaria magnacalcarata]CAF4673047.1 unnamed protein product [Rotaria magnacalcarata]CAF5066270.1 unnamed protein product [Rotaria magnacalcarata]
MVRETKITLRTKHINCVYCIALSFFILAIVLFVLSSEQSTTLNNQQNRIPVIISALIILLLSIIIFIWMTYYTIEYFRLKKRQQLSYVQNQMNENSSEIRTTTPAIIFDNATFTMDDPIVMNSSTNNQTSA